MMRKNAVFGAVAGIAAFFIMGIPTALVPTGLFARMIPASQLDYLLLFLTSLLIGVFAFYSFRKKALEGKGSYAAAGGAVGGVFAFGCSVCNAILVALLGTAAVLAYFEPFRPFLGAASIAILAFAIRSARKSCGSCETKK